MNEPDPADAPEDAQEPAATIGDTIRALRALRKELRAKQAEQNLRRYPNACRGARIAGVPVSSLPPELRGPCPAEDGDDD